MIPATKFNDLFRDAAELVSSNGRANEMAIRRVEKQADRLRETGADISGSWEVLAMCQAARRNVEGVETSWQRSLTSGDRDRYSTLRFSSAFLDSGAEERARDLALHAIKESPQDAVVVRAAAHILGRGGYVIEGTEWESVADELENGDGSKRGLAEIMRNWDGEELAQVIRFARHHLFDHDVTPQNGSTWFSCADDEQTPALVYELHVALGPEEAAEREFALVDALLEQNYGIYNSGRLMVSVASKLTDEGSQDASQLQ